MPQIDLTIRTIGPDVFVWCCVGAFVGMLLLSRIKTWSLDRHHAKHLPKREPVQPTTNTGEGVRATRPFGGNTPL